MLHQPSTWNLLGHRANPKRPLSSKADVPCVASAVYVPECSRTARILDHSGVGLQGVAQLIYNNKTSPSTPVFLNQPLHLARASYIVWLARLLTSNQAFNNKTAWATRTLFAVNVISPNVILNQSGLLSLVSLVRVWGRRCWCCQRGVVAKVFLPILLEG